VSVSLLQTIWRKAAMPRESAIVQRTLEMLVLKALSLAPMHGWGIGQRIDQLSKGAFQVQQGSLYPALLRMRRQGWIRSEWRTTGNKRRARYYLLTAAGRRQLRAETATWEKASEAVNAFLRTTSLEGNA
jgi:transcriptional regulator